MIDPELLGQEINDILKEYCAAPQIIKADQDIPEEEIQEVRIVWNVTSNYIPGKSTPILKKETIPGIINPERFEFDIKYTAINNPGATISYTLYAPKNIPGNSQIIQKAREWFSTPFLGPLVIDTLTTVKAVIADVSEIQDRGTILEEDREDRRGFDVVFRFEEKIESIVETIEEVQQQGTIKTD